MVETKKEHYVHQGFLKLFFKDYDEIYVLNMKNKYFYSKAFEGIKDIACENYFYDIDIKNEDKKMFEKIFAEKFEPKFTNSLKEISINQKLNTKNKKDLSIFVAFQLLRGKRFRNFLIDFSKTYITEKIEDYLKENLNKEDFNSFNKDFLKIDLKESHIHIEVLFKKIINLAININSKNCHLIINKTDTDFITGSEPIYAHGNSHKGILNYNVFILSITPKLANNFRKKIKKDCKVVEVNHQKIINEINKKILSRSEYIYLTNELQLKEYSKKIYKYKDINTEVKNYKDVKLIRCKF